MNYYERYCGDYARDTAHLSLQEHGAYTVMLDTYYATETPLPADYAPLYRICRAMGAKEQGAVRSVADQFFPVHEDGLRHNNKADEVIAKAQKRIAAAKANGAKNKEPTGIPTGYTDGQPNTVASGPIGTSTRPQTPTTTTSKALSGKPDLKPLAIETLNFLNAKTGHAYKPVDSNLRLITSLLKQGFTPDDIRAVIVTKCRQWAGDPRMADYLRPITLFRASNFANYEGQLAQVSDGN